MSRESDFFGVGQYTRAVPRPKDRPKKPQSCSRCHVLYDGPTEKLIRNLYERGWRALVPLDGPSEMLCPDCVAIHERNERATAE